jgi:transcriptional regulator with XRE-family HTH domain
MKEIISRNLKYLRELNNYKQDDLASFLKINRSTYANYECGDRETPLGVLEKISDLYGCDLATLWEENQEAVEEMLSCAFRVENISVSDMQEIARFKKIVKNYFKINRLLS